MRSVSQCIIGFVQAILLAVMLVLLAPSPSIAQNDGGTAELRKPGILWNRTGLPAVFPLQVKTLIGQDYLMTLLQQDTKKEVFAAYIAGGKFFRVLVPPGTFVLRFTEVKYGLKDGESVAPDARNASFELPKPLTFAIRGTNTKAGHIVDLRDVQGGSFADATIKQQAICQGVYVEFGAPPDAQSISQTGLLYGTASSQNETVYLNDPISQWGLYPRIDQDMRMRMRRATPPRTDPPYSRFDRNPYPRASLERFPSMRRPDPYEFDRPLYPRPAAPVPRLKDADSAPQKNLIYSRYCS